MTELDNRPAPGSETDLPPMPVWQARSFWFGLFTLAAFAAPIFGIQFDRHEWTERVMEIMPFVTALIAYRERMNPHRRLTLRSR